MVVVMMMMKTENHWATGSHRPIIGVGSNTLFLNVKPWWWWVQMKLKATHPSKQTIWVGSKKTERKGEKAVPLGQTITGHNFNSRSYRIDRGGEMARRS